MKTEITIPDRVFCEAETLAKSMGVSRDELYTVALVSLLAKHDAKVTEQLNEVYREEDSALDPVLAELQFRSLTVEDW
jgi:hypothetical protein